MTREEIIEQLRKILLTADSRNSAIADSLTEDADLATDLGLTSVGMLYIVIAIEETFGISFDNVGMNDFSKLSDVVDYIEKKL